jgi:hypothetical protein
MAIGTKVTTEIVRQKRFAFDPSVFDANELLDLLNTPEQADLHQSLVDQLTALRAVPLKQLAWLKIFKLGQALLKKYPRASTPQLTEQLRSACERTYNRTYQADLRQAMLALQRDPQTAATMLAFLGSDAPTRNQMILCQLAAVDDASLDIAHEMQHFKNATPADRLRALLDRSRQLGFHGEVLRKLIKQMVIRNAACDNAEYLRKDPIQIESTLQIPLVPLTPKRWKTKTVYRFNMERFLNDLETSPHDKNLRSLETHLQQAFNKAVFKQHKFCIRSRMFATHAAILGVVQQDFVKMNADPARDSD